MGELFWITTGALSAAWGWEAYRAWKYRRLYLDQLKATQQLDGATKVFRESAVVMKWRGKVLAWPEDVEPVAVFDRLVWLAGQDVESDS